ncbi:MAG: dITP/XTP pyrophosphatase [Gammaproteobacteria bacterium]|nr:MAG: dITP/XTP pyrophosphatase [Gammaproteobacteria bacterium]TND02913.1 MAG: dITP/XTP pyrophosphatase [Gammaproteobacteria bacterium]
MNTVVLATSNRGKLAELRALLAPLGIEVRAQAEFGVPEAAETGLTFVENALIKARNAARHCGLPAIADDSGLEVDALHGAPGIYSSRYAGDEATDQDNCRKLLEDLRDVAEPERHARFQCLMVLLESATDPTPVISQGTWEGRILLAPRGTGGFGYDPLFYVPTHDCASAELAPADKNRLSHRGQALRGLVAAIGLSVDGDWLA